MPRPTLRDVHPQNAALQNISIGYRNSEYIFRQIFPVIEVDKKSDFYFVFDRQSWFTSRSGQRAPGTRAPRAGYSLTTASYLCVNDSLATPVPDEVIDNADLPLRPLITATNFVSDGLELGAEIRVAALVTASTNWAYAASPASQWSNDNSDPWGDIDAAKNNVVIQVARMPNTAVLSWDTWRHLSQHPDFLDRIKYTRASGRVEPGDLRSWFGFEKVLIGMAIKDVALEGQSASQSFVWGDGFWCGYVPPTAALEVPAAGYTLVWKDANREMKQYREEAEHQWIIESGWETDEVITASEAGAVLYNCV